ncbi:hypothetical protein [Paenisporosarcina indica]|uniref:hypothetical protein n=1 Tax=Paenisporosarcina indica TaxID=650093 RepID=UPI00094FEB2B|nr:hypothetical protein [Paenisporosarcina indica]
MFYAQLSVFLSPILAIVIVFNSVSLIKEIVREKDPDIFLKTIIISLCFAFIVFTITSLTYDLG